ncbi:RNA-binding domain-containing protein [Streptomyces sp. BBFR102]|uniref:RNA-binding domain-containing protein n=1 Tax=Streptomyces sp. BBFR102 TaxID=3448171 RepID=UPI003F52DCC0
MSKRELPIWWTAVCSGGYCRDGEGSEGCAGRAGRPGAGLSARIARGPWVDAKSGPYQLADPKAVEELTKDVAAFANGGGGVIVIGIATRPDHDEEVLAHIVGVDPAAVNVDQIRKLIRQRITPAPRGVRIGWSGADGERVLFIDVPARAVDTLFVVPAPVGKPGSPRTDTVAVPMRDGDSTYWLPRSEIQQLRSARCPGLRDAHRPGPHRARTACRLGSRAG